VEGEQVQSSKFRYFFTSTDQGPTFKDNARRSQSTATENKTESITHPTHRQSLPGDVSPLETGLPLTEKSGRQSAQQ